MIQYEKEICRYLDIPAIPKKKWDGKRSFKYGVAVANLVAGNDAAYVVVSFDAQVDDKPHVVKVFAIGQYDGIDYGSITVVPDYMDVDGVETWDIDDASKKAAQSLIEEAKEMQDAEDDDDGMVGLPEWIFPEITTKDEAVAWLKSYNKMNRIKKGRIPTSEDALKMRLFSIYSSNKTRK